MRRPAWAELVRSGLAQTRARSHGFEWVLNWASAGLGSLNWISMGSSGVNWVSTGLASLDQASAGRHSCFCFECCSFPCCLLLSFGCVFLATLAIRDLSFAVCYMSRAFVLYVTCRALLASRAACCVLPAGTQHVSSPLYFSSRLLLCVFVEIVSRFRLFWQRIAVVNDFGEV